MCNYVTASFPCLFLYFSLFFGLRYKGTYLQVPSDLPTATLRVGPPHTTNRGSLTDENERKIFEPCGGSAESGKSKREKKFRAC